MASTFGAPSTDLPMDDAAAQQQHDPSGDAVEVLDPNDPALTSESLDINTEGDAYAQPAPPPDGLITTSSPRPSASSSTSSSGVHTAAISATSTPPLDTPARAAAKALVPIGQRLAAAVEAAERANSDFVRRTALEDVARIGEELAGAIDALD